MTATDVLEPCKRSNMLSPPTLLIKVDYVEYVVILLASVWVIGVAEIGAK